MAGTRAALGQAPSPLRYPHKDGPGPAEAIEVGPGVFWARIPLGSALNYTNVWLIEDGPSWTVVDTGLSTDQTHDAWREIFANVLKGRPIKRVIATHLHPDHIGAAGWLVEEFDGALWMSQTEYLQCRMLFMDTGREAPHEGTRFYVAAGFDDRALRQYKERFGRFGSAIFRLPQAYHRLREGDTVRIGAHDWQVVIGRGHVPEHVCLWCKALNLFISGDQILPRISSNISVHPTEPEANPLQDWIDSCAQLRALLPVDVLVLPAHNEPFFGARERLTDLIEEHESRLNRLLVRCRKPHRAVDIFGDLFSRPINDASYHMATGESLAHLNCLRARGQITRRADAAGVDWYETV